MRCDQDHFNFNGPEFSDWYFDLDKAEQLGEDYVDSRPLVWSSGYSPTDCGINYLFSSSLFDDLTLYDPSTDSDWANASIQETENKQKNYALFNY